MLIVFLWLGMRRAKGLDGSASLKEKLPEGISLSGVLIVEVDQLRTRRHLMGKIRLPVASWPIQHDFQSSSSSSLDLPRTSSSSSSTRPSSSVQHAPPPPPLHHHHDHRRPAVGLPSSGAGDNRRERLRHLAEEEEQQSIPSPSSRPVLSPRGKTNEDKDEDALQNTKQEPKKNRKSFSPSLKKGEEVISPTISRVLSLSFMERQRLKRYLSSRAGERHLISIPAKEGKGFSLMDSSSRGMMRGISEESASHSEKIEKGHEGGRRSPSTKEDQGWVGKSSSEIEKTGGGKKEAVERRDEKDDKEENSSRRRPEEGTRKNKRKIGQEEKEEVEKERKEERRDGEKEEKERDSLRTARHTGEEGHHHYHLADNPYFDEEMARDVHRASLDDTLGLRPGDVLLSIENIGEETSRLPCASYLFRHPSTACARIHT